MWIYRAMEEDGGLPRLGMTATTLGIRLGKDISVDAAGMVHQPSFEANEPNGLSCVPDPAGLPIFALPVSLGGKSKKTVVWKIDTDDLGADPMAQEDSDPGDVRHVSIGPATTMTAGAFADAIEATRRLWKPA